MKNKQTMDQKAKNLIRARAVRDRLSDGYVRNLLTKNSSLRASDIPQSLVDVKKAHLLLKEGSRQYVKTTPINLNNSTYLMPRLIRIYTPGNRSRADHPEPHEPAVPDRENRKQSITPCFLF